MRAPASLFRVPIECLALFCNSVGVDVFFLFGVYLEVELRFRVSRI